MNHLLIDGMLRTFTKIVRLAGLLILCTLYVDIGFGDQTVQPEVPPFWTDALSANIHNLIELIQMPTQGVGIEEPISEKFKRLQSAIETSTGGTLPIFVDVQIANIKVPRHGPAIGMSIYDIKAHDAIKLMCAVLGLEHQILSQGVIIRKRRNDR